MTTEAQQCIRRRHSVWTTCTCPPCKADQARMEKIARTGHYHRVTSETAWEHIDRLLAAKWSSAAIASAANLSTRYVDDMLRLDRRGKRQRIGARNAAAIVSIKGDPTRGHIDATGARRRLQALAVLGHSVDAIHEAHPDLAVNTLYVIRKGRTRTISPATNARIRDVYEQMSGHRGPAVVAAGRAVRRGWAAPMAWDNIDDSRERPKGVSRTEKFLDEVAVRRAVSGHAVRLTSAERAEATRLLREQGLSYAAVADRLRVTDRSVARIIAKAKAPEQVAS